MEKIESFEKQVNAVALKVNSVGTAIKDLQDKIGEYESWTKKTDTRVEEISKKQEKFVGLVENLREMVEKLKGDVIFTRTESTKAMRQIDDDFKQLEHFSRENNIRIFGLPENSDEDCTELAKSIIAETGLKGVEVVKAYRITNPNVEKNTQADMPRPLLCTILRYNDKLEILQKQGVAKSKGYVIMDEQGTQLAQKKMEAKQVSSPETREEGNSDQESPVDPRVKPDESPRTDSGESSAGNSPREKTALSPKSGRNENLSQANDNEMNLSDSRSRSIRGRAKRRKSARGSRRHGRGGGTEQQQSPGTEYRRIQPEEFDLSHISWPELGATSPAETTISGVTGAFPLGTSRIPRLKEQTTKSVRRSLEGGSDETPPSN